MQNLDAAMPFIESSHLRLLWLASNFNSLQDVVPDVIIVSKVLLRGEGAGSEGWCSWCNSLDGLSCIAGRLQHSTQSMQ